MWVGAAIFAAAVSGPFVDGTRRYKQMILAAVGPAVVLAVFFSLYMSETFHKSVVRTHYPPARRVFIALVCVAWMLACVFAWLCVFVFVCFQSCVSSDRSQCSLLLSLSCRGCARASASPAAASLPS